MPESEYSEQWSQSKASNIRKVEIVWMFKRSPNYKFQEKYFWAHKFPISIYKNGKNISRMKATEPTAKWSWKDNFPLLSTHYLPLNEIPRE